MIAKKRKLFLFFLFCSCSVQSAWPYLQHTGSGVLEMRAMLMCRVAAVMGRTLEFPFSCCLTHAQRLCVEWRFSFCLIHAQR